MSSNVRCIHLAMITTLYTRSQVILGMHKRNFRHSNAVEGHLISSAYRRDANIDYPEVKSPLLFSIFNNNRLLRGRHALPRNLVDGVFVSPTIETRTIPTSEYAFRWRGNIMR